MPKVNFKAYLTPAKERMPSDLEIIVATYGPYLTMSEAARCLKRSTKTIERYIKAGGLSASQGSQGKRYIIPATSIVKLVRELSRAAS